ncbi:MAG TPA: hypothetical protein VFI31_18570 [Pirellulales bacterium]|nr:hypothetical protein [Pirellulales bacterium]
MRTPSRDPLTSSLDAANFTSAMQTAAAAAEQFTARVAQTLGLSPSAVPNQSTPVSTPLPAAGSAGAAQLFGNLFGGRGGGTQPFAQLQQTFAQLGKNVQQAVQATGKGRDAANLQLGKLQDGANNMFAALAKGNDNVAGFAAAIGRANDAVQGFVNNLAKAGQAQFAQFFGAPGRLVPANQQRQAAVQVQMAQQVGQLLAQFSKQIGQSLQGGEQIQQMVDAANAAGNPQQAIDIARSYVTAQLNQSLINAQNLANSVDPVMHSFGATGQLAPQGNLQYLLSQPGQLQDTIRMFQNMLDNLNKLQAGLDKARPMAAGGVVTDPTMALVGEAGPEAIIPLDRLQAMFGNPANLFLTANAFGTNPGDGAINPLGVTAAQLANFDTMFARASQVLNQQLDLGNRGAAGILDRWNQMQDAAVQAIETMSQRRRIDLAPSAGVLPNQNHAATLQAAAGALHFNFGDINVTGGMAQQEIGSLFDRIENEARSRGYDLTGRSALRRPPQVARGPLTPAGYAR